jgi:hypothetical protein
VNSSLNDPLPGYSWQPIESTLQGNSLASAGFESPEQIIVFDLAIIANQLPQPKLDFIGQPYHIIYSTKAYFIFFYIHSNSIEHLKTN